MKKIRNIKICHLHNANKIGQKICNQYDAWNEKKNAKKYIQYLMTI